MRLPLGSWIWLKAMRLEDLVAGTISTGIETSASRIRPDQYARAAIGNTPQTGNEGSILLNYFAEMEFPHAGGEHRKCAFGDWRNGFVLTTFPNDFPSSP